MSSRKRSIILTDKQEKYVDGIMSGKNKHVAATAAGYSSSAVADKSKTVQAALAEQRKNLREAVLITRADVIDGILESINLARTAAEPATMIAGWREIAKMLGHYEPEVKKVELTVNQQVARSKLTSMSDEDLLQLIENGEIIEGESERVH